MAASALGILALFFVLARSPHVLYGVGNWLAGGLVYGASDSIGGYVKERPVPPEDFGATLFDALGIAPETRYGVDGFSERVSAGEPIRELFE